MTRAEDLRELPEGELAQRITDARREVFGLRFSHATGELENTAGMKTTKRELARALTVARQRDLNLDAVT